MTWERVAFALISGGTFIALGICSYAAYGDLFLQEAFLYHLKRSDHRHNFSPYWYGVYLNIGKPPPTVLQKIMGALPQLTSVIAIGAKYAADLPFCLFLQTLAFVTFNKVVTAQYFVWYFCLLPLVLPF